MTTTDRRAGGSFSSRHRSSTISAVADEPFASLGEDPTRGDAFGNSVWITATPFILLGCLSISKLLEPGRFRSNNSHSRTNSILVSRSRSISKIHFINGGGVKLQITDVVVGMLDLPLTPPCRDWPQKLPRQLSWLTIHASLNFG